MINIHIFADFKFVVCEEIVGAVSPFLAKRFRSWSFSLSLSLSLSNRILLSGNEDYEVSIDDQATLQPCLTGIGIQMGIDFMYVWDVTIENVMVSWYFL